jgi:hypothetical protein
MASLISANFFCPRCRKQRAFLPIDFAALLADVTRRTIYRWMDRGWLHWRTIPNGRRLVCLQSLTKAHGVDAVLLESLLRRGTLPVENK